MSGPTISPPLQAVEMAREGFGEDDPHMASACNNLAEFYRIRRQYDAAEPLYRQVRLLARGRVTACSGPLVNWLQDSCSCRCSCRSLSRFPCRCTSACAVRSRACRFWLLFTSVPYPMQALEVLTRAYGLHDARVAFALHNLGGFYLSQVRSMVVCRWMCLPAQLSHLPDHKAALCVATSRTMLLLLLCFGAQFVHTRTPSSALPALQRKLEQAAECYEQALKMKLEVLGTGHR